MKTRSTVSEKVLSSKASSKAHNLPSAKPGTGVGLNSGAPSPSTSTDAFRDPPKKKVASKASKTPTKPPVTPDGHYFIIRGRLWRCTNPHLSSTERQKHTNSLMDARRAVKAAMKSGDSEEMKEARAAVQDSKEKLGERGEVWWKEEEGGRWDRFLAKNSVYKEWEEGLE